MTDKLAEHICCLSSPNSHGSCAACNRRADAIRRNPRAHIDALVEAGVLISRRRGHEPAYLVVTPLHKCRWCKKPIINTRPCWVHADTQLRSCRSTLAEPEEHPAVPQADRSEGSGGDG